MKTSTKSLEASLRALEQLRPSNPKRSSSAADTWYSYYAGYADAFVKDIVGALPDGSLTILDPWNGSGTTTAVATRQSRRSKGFDLNPAAIVIAKARILQSDVADSIGPLTDDILSSADAGVTGSLADDLLTTWISPQSAREIRSIEIRLRTLLVGSKCVSGVEAVDRLSALAALFYLGLFRTVRTLLSPFVGSNPTWIRRNVDPRRRIRPTRDTVHQLFRNAMSELTQLVEGASNAYDDEHCPSDIHIGSSSSLPLTTASVDAVITSPPYCTRIDYVVATLPELAILGMKADELKTLRDKMIGTPTIPSGASDALAQSGNKAAALLRQITEHESKASAGYYRRFFVQYLDGMHESLSEIRRVTKKGSPAVFVVQDSYYKEIHIDLAAILSDMATGIGWEPVGRHDFPVIARRNYATINPRSRVYRDSSRATESVLVMGAS